MKPKCQCSLPPTVMSIARPGSKVEAVKAMNKAKMAKPPAPKLFILISMQKGHSEAKLKRTDYHFRTEVGFL